ncbi:uncharacterized protein [Nicotiana tomentosiformis]|uniref:uncharacterized protein n=1 Tax=Nicotiana tomentosiformis TaxID=4098 RepID=UPI00388CC7FB
MVNDVTLRSGQVLKDPTPVQKKVVPKNESGKERKIEDDKKKKAKKGVQKKKEETSRMEESNKERKHISFITNTNLCQILEGDPYKEEEDRGDLSGQAHRALQCNIAKQTPTKVWRSMEFYYTLKPENELGEVRFAPISLQLADQMTIIPEGIVEDVLVRVDKFVFSVDFILVKMEENKKIRLILGKPFLATGREI